MDERPEPTPTAWVQITISKSHAQKLVDALDWLIGKYGPITDAELSVINRKIKFEILNGKG